MASWLGQSNYFRWLKKINTTIAKFWKTARCSSFYTPQYLDQVVISLIPVPPKEHRIIRVWPCYRLAKHKDAHQHCQGYESMEHPLECKQKDAQQPVFLWCRTNITIGAQGSSTSVWPSSFPRVGEEHSWFKKAFVQTVKAGYILLQRIQDECLTVSVVMFVVTVDWLHC